MKEALEAFDEALRLKGEDVVYWYNKGLTLSNLGRNKTSIDTRPEIVLVVDLVVTSSKLPEVNELAMN